MTFQMALNPPSESSVLLLADNVAAVSGATGRIAMSMSAPGETLCGKILIHLLALVSRAGTLVLRIGRDILMLDCYSSDVACGRALKGP